MVRCFLSLGLSIYRQLNYEPLLPNLISRDARGLKKRNRKLDTKLCFSTLANYGIFITHLSCLKCKRAYYGSTETAPPLCMSAVWQNRFKARNFTHKSKVEKNSFKKTLRFEMTKPIQQLCSTAIEAESF